MAGLAAQLPTGRFSTDALLTPESPYSAALAAEPNIKELAAVALDAAKSAGAGYADVRFVRNRSQTVSTREQRVQGISDSETYGFGVRTRRRPCLRSRLTGGARVASRPGRGARPQMPSKFVPKPCEGTWKIPSGSIQHLRSKTIFHVIQFVGGEGRALSTQTYFFPRGRPSSPAAVHLPGDLSHAAVDDVTPSAAAAISRRATR